MSDNENEEDTCEWECEACGNCEHNCVCEEYYGDDYEGWLRGEHD